MASNTCKNFYRHKKVLTDSHAELKYLDSDHSESDFAKTASKLDGAEFRRILEEVLNEMPSEKKEAFILRYQEDKSIAEIALIQECPEGSVKSRLHYTIKLLEEKLKIFDPLT
jgi:RNA polymerase sigma-70 factor, ECF subfamily